MPTPTQTAPLTSHSIGVPPADNATRRARSARLADVAHLLTRSEVDALQRYYVAGRFGRSQPHPQRTVVYFSRALAKLRAAGVEWGDVPLRTFGVNGTEVWTSDDEIESRSCDVCDKRYPATLGSGYKPFPPACDRYRRSREQAQRHGSRYYAQSWDDPEY